MADTKKELIFTEEDGQISIQGDAHSVKKAIMVLGEFFSNKDEMTVERLDTLVDIAEELMNSSETKAAAKKFLETAEKYSHPRATNLLATLQENPLISDAMDFKAAARGDEPSILALQETYETQADLWQKKIDAAEGKPIEGNVPTKEEILNADRTSFFEIYERAFNRDLEAMKTCLDFCKKEADYWSKR